MISEMNLENEAVKHVLSIAKEGDETPFDDEWEVIDYLTDKDRIVWKDPDIDYHRWYHAQAAVAKVGGRLVRFTIYSADGDSDVGDCVSTPLDGIHFVIPYEKTVTCYKKPD